MFWFGQKTPSQSIYNKLITQLIGTRIQSHGYCFSLFHNSHTLTAHKSTFFYLFGHMIEIYLRDSRWTTNYCTSVSSSNCSVYCVTRYNLREHFTFTHHAKQKQPHSVTIISNVRLECCSIKPIKWTTHSSRTIYLRLFVQTLIISH